MTVYWSACILSIVLAFIGKHISFGKYKSSILATISAIPLIVVSSVRYDVGTDYMFTYMNIFNSVKYTGEYDVEPLYFIINKVAVFLNVNYVFVFSVSAFLFCILVYLQIFRDSKNVVLSIALLILMPYYYMSLSLVRQMIAASILLYSIRYIEIDNFKKFILCIFFAMGFHYTSIVFVPIYFIRNVKISPKYIGLIMIALYAINNFITILSYEIIKLTGYSVYIGSKYDLVKESSLTMYINIALVLFVSYYLKNKIISKKYNIYYNLQICALWTSMMIGNVVHIDRIHVYFALPSIILIPSIIKTIKKEEKIVVTTFLIVLYIIYSYYSIYVNGNFDVIPYNTIF